MQWLVDGVVTLVCWLYFLFAFLLFFWICYLAAYLFTADRERSFQYLNHCFFKGFLALLRVMAPAHRWKIDRRVGEIRGSIIVCNHLSYLDPLLFLSLLSQNKTIVKTKFFSAPVFGLLLDISGYLPSTTEGRFAGMMIERVEGMGKFFEGGGNLFVFPEGTRNSGASVERLHKGVFKIARMYQCPVEVLRISGTDTLFTPGHFFFNTTCRNRIDLQSITTIQSDPAQGKMTVSTLHQKVRDAFLQHTGSVEQVVV